MREASSRKHDERRAGIRFTVLGGFLHAIFRHTMQHSFSLFLSDGCMCTTISVSTYSIIPWIQNVNCFLPNT